MADLPLPPLPGRQAALGTLLAEVADGLVAAQRRLDADAGSRAAGYFETPQGEVTLPPLWYTFTEVTLEVALSASVERASGSVPSRLMSRPVDPRQVSLYGYQAASGLMVRLRLAPRQGMPDVASPPA